MLSVAAMWKMSLCEMAKEIFSWKTIMPLTLPQFHGIEMKRDNKSTSMLLKVVVFKAF